MDINAAENALRSIAIGRNYVQRKNYLFVGSDRGGRAAATRRHHNHIRIRIVTQFADMNLNRWEERLTVGQVKCLAPGPCHGSGR